MTPTASDRGEKRRRGTVLLVTILTVTSVAVGGVGVAAGATNGETTTAAVPAPSDGTNPGTAAQVDLSISVRTTRGDRLTGSPVALIAEGQPIRVQVSYSGLGPGDHRLRVVDHDAVDSEVFRTFTVSGDSGQETFEIAYSPLGSAIDDVFEADNTLELQVQWVSSDGRVRESSGSYLLGRAGTTTYVTDVPERVAEGESTTVTVYGWTSYDDVSVYLAEDDGIVGEEDRLETLNIRPSGNAYERRVRITPSEIPEENEATPNVVELYSEPASNGPASYVIRLESGSGFDEIAIDRSTNDPPVADAGDSRTVTATQSVTLDAGGSSDPDGDSLSYTWEQTGGPSVSLSDADTATPEFTAPEVSSESTLTFELAVSDGEATRTDTVSVAVSPDDDSDSGDDDGGTDDGGSAASVTFGSDQMQVPDGGTTTVPVVVEGVDGGVGAYDLTVSVADPGTVEIVGISSPDGQAEATSVADDGASATAKSFGDDTSDSGEVRILSVTVRGADAGQTSLSIEGEVGTESAEAYDPDFETATLRVSEQDGDGSAGVDVDGDGRPSTNVDGDPAHEDVNGDGQVSVLDVQVLFANRGDDAVTNNPTLFDFNGDGEVSVLDVQRLFAEL